MTVYPVGTAISTHATAGSVTGAWGATQFRVAGHLLVAVVTAGASTSVTATLNAGGWTKALEVGNTATAHVEAAIWTKTAAGSDAAPTFTATLTGTGAMDCMLFELSGANTASPVDVSATYASGSVAGTVSGTATTAALTANGEFAISVFAQNAAAGNLTFTDSGTGSFSKVLNGNGVSSVLQTYAGVVGPPGAAALNDAGAFSVNTTAFGAGIVIAFAQAVRVTPAINFLFANNAAATVTAGGTASPVSGTVESWTVNVTSPFPAASATAGPPVQFSVIDPALPAEKFMVTASPGGTGGAQSWTVTRGAEATTPAGHTAGFAILPVITAGWAQGVSRELSETAYVDADYTGTNDSSAAFNAAVASLPVVNGRAVGSVIFGPGTVKFTVTPDNPGPCVYVQGAGKWATFINSFVTGGDCFRIFDSSAASAQDNTTNGGGIKDMTVNGNNAGAGSVGLHIGDVTDYEVDCVVLNFQGAGSKGAWFDNELYFTEQLRGELYVSGCTQCVVFDNPAAAAATSSSSFARCNMVIKLGQGLDGSGQVWGDGVVLQNGALLVDSDITIIGNYTLSAASTSAAVLRITGSTPAGHSFSTQAGITYSRLNIGVELDAHGGNSNAPMSIFSDGTGHIVGCYGVMDFGASSGVFGASNIANQLILSDFNFRGDNNLGAQGQVNDAEQFCALASPYTLTSTTSAQKLFNTTASGALTVPPGNTYFFECEFDITGLSGSAHTISFGFGGSATYTSCKYVAHRIDTSTALSTAQAWTDQIVTAATATALTAAGVTTTIFAARISGAVVVNNGGTIIPQITMGTNAAAAVVGTNSWFRMNIMGYSASAGTWS